MELEKVNGGVGRTYQVGFWDVHKHVPLVCIFYAEQIVTFPSMTIHKVFIFLEILQGFDVFINISKSKSGYILWSCEAMLLMLSSVTAEKTWKFFPLSWRRLSWELKRILGCWRQSAISPGIFGWYFARLLIFFKLLAFSIVLPLLLFVSS